MWVTLMDVIASKILTGKTPQIEEGILYSPNRPQKQLRGTNILGYRIDPRKNNLFKFFVEERQKIKKEMKSWIKILRNI